MLLTINPSEFDQIGTIRTGTGSNTDGRKVITYSDTYTSVRAKRLNPLRTFGGEGVESVQDVYIEENSWLIRKEDRAIVPKKMVYLIGAKIHHIVNVRDYKADRLYFVLDTEFRDNE